MRQYLSLDLLRPEILARTVFAFTGVYLRGFDNLPSCDAHVYLLDDSVHLWFDAEEPLRISVK
jgi:hypothetical protein